MSIPIPSDEFFNFVKENAYVSTASLRLKMYGKQYPFDMDFAILQIDSRRRCRKKLKSFLNNDKFLFPTAIAAEQASHEAIAKFHSSLTDSYENVLDMTAGLGIDALSLAMTSRNVTACEIDTLKADILELNRMTLGIGNLKVVNANSIEWLENTGMSFDTIFIDPARRDKCNARVYNLHDCQPDILKEMRTLLKNCNRLIIKASPLLDITCTIKDIPESTAIRAISVNGECKEVLIEADKRLHNESMPFMEAINLAEDGDIISRFSYKSEDCGKQITFADISDISEEIYLYEPDASMMKLSPWNELSLRFEGLKKLGPSSHLFVSGRNEKMFPGRKLRIAGIIDKQAIKHLKGKSANVVTRNYPMSAEELRKKLKLKEGENMFVYGTRVGTRPILILAVRSTE